MKRIRKLPDGIQLIIEISGYKPKQSYSTVHTVKSLDFTYLSKEWG